MTLVNNIYRRLLIFQQILYISIKQWSAFRVNMLLMLLIGPINMLAQYFIWKSVLSTSNKVNGMGLKELMTYYAVTTLISALIADDTAYVLRGHVYHGSLVTILQKPISYMYYSFSEKIGKRLVSLFVEVLPLSLIFVLVFHINLQPSNLAWALISIILGFVQVYLVNFCIGVTSFWLVENWGIVMSTAILTNICSGMLIPLVFFPDVIQKLLFILPFQFMYYIPARVVLGSYELAGISLTQPQIVLLQLAYTAAMWAVSVSFWRAGTKKFMGVGT